MNEQNPSSVTGAKNPLPLVLIGLIIVSLAGAGVHLWHQSQVSLHQSQISSLQEEVAKLRQQLADAEARAAAESIQALPQNCKNEAEGLPVITSLSAYSGAVGTELEIRGCNFAGFEGDKNAWIVNGRGEAGILYGESGSDAKLLRVALVSPLCQEDTSYTGLECEKYMTLTPGTYEIYALPWDKESNRVKFVIR